MKIHCLRKYTGHVAPLALSAVSLSLHAQNVWQLGGNAVPANKDNKLGTTANSAPNKKDLILITDDAERMRVTESGNVGIGISTPSEKLHVSGSFLEKLGKFSFDNTNNFGGLGISGAGTHFDNGTERHFAGTVDFSGFGFGISAILNSETAAERFSAGTRNGEAFMTYKNLSTNINHVINIQPSLMAFRFNDAIGVSKVLTLDNTGFNFIHTVNGDLMKIHDDGNVRIGVASGPNNKLDVFKDLQNTTSIRSNQAAVLQLESDEDNSSNAYDPILRFMNDGIDVASPNIWSIGTDASDGHSFKISSSANPGNSDRITILRNNGNVGIGTTTPTALLEVAGDPFDENIRLTDAGNAGVSAKAMVQAYDNAGDAMWFVGDAWIDDRNLALSNKQPGGNVILRTENLDRVTVDNTGNVGIATGTPTAQLHVENSLRYVDGTEGLNKVLTSDVDGNAHWEDASNLFGGGNASFTDLDVTGRLKVGTSSIIINQLGPGPGLNNIYTAAGSGNLLINSPKLIMPDPADNTAHTILNAGVNTGNVGIGTTNPGEKLDVSGAINTSDHYSIGGTKILSNTGSLNIFVGELAGNNNAGNGNSFLGAAAGLNNTIGIGNTFLGFGSGGDNTDGNFNIFIGNSAGQQNTSGSSNICIGVNSGVQGNMGGENTYLGHQAHGDPSLFNATAIGANAYVTANHSIVLGAIGTNVGIGITNPTSKLVIADPSAIFRFDGSASTSGYTTSFKMDDVALKIGHNSNIRDIQFFTQNAEITQLIIKPNGFVGIGVVNPDHRLDVCGTIRAKKVLVEAFSCDFVFEDDYYLRTISEVEEYIEQNGHLPDIPPATEVDANGIEVGDFQARLLRKIEELTLYVIKQDKRIEELEKKGTE